MTLDSEVLVGIATLGLTLTGFSGLVAIMGKRGSGHWSGGERVQFIELAVISLTVTFSSFVPIVVSLEVSGDVSHRVSLGIIAAAHLGCLVRGLSTVLKTPEARAEYAPGVIIFMIAGGLLIIGASLLAAFGFFGSYAFWILLNLLWLLFVAVVNFVQLLTSSSYMDDS